MTPVPGLRPGKRQGAPSASRNDGVLPPDHIDALIAGRFPNANERRWRALPWCTDPRTVMRDAAAHRSGILLAIVDGTMADEAVRLGKSGLWRSPLTEGGIPDALRRGWNPVLIPRSDIQRLVGPMSPIHAAVARIPKDRNPCGIAGYIVCAPNGSPPCAIAAKDASVVRLRQLLETAGAAKRAAAAILSEKSGSGSPDDALRLDVAVRRVQRGTSDEFLKGFPVEIRSIGFSTDDSLGLGPPTAHGESGQRWNLPRPTVDRLWCAFRPDTGATQTASVPAESTVQAEVVWSGRGCRVAYHGRWTTAVDGGLPASAKLDIRVEGYGVFGADRMPRAVRLATTHASWGDRTVAAAAREA